MSTGTPLADALGMRLITLMGAVLLFAVPLAGDEAITVSVTPAMSVEPANICVRVTVVPDSANRAMEVVAESATYYRSSAVSLDGDKAARSTTFDYRDLPAGDYEVRGTLLGRNGQARAVSRRRFMVME
jgi:hypothetical protein